MWALGLIHLKKKKSPKKVQKKSIFRMIFSCFISFPKFAAGRSQLYSRTAQFWPWEVAPARRFWVLVFFLPRWNPTEDHKGLSQASFGNSPMKQTPKNKRRNKNWWPSFHLTWNADTTSTSILLFQGYFRGESKGRKWFFCCCLFFFLRDTPRRAVEGKEWKLPWVTKPGLLGRILPCLLPVECSKE